MGWFRIRVELELKGKFGSGNSVCDDDLKCNVFNAFKKKKTPRKKKISRNHGENFLENWGVRIEMDCLKKKLIFISSCTFIVN